MLHSTLTNSFVTEILVLTEIDLRTDLPAEVWSLNAKIGLCTSVHTLLQRSRLTLKMEEKENSY